jgi:hypothetical protein
VDYTAELIADGGTAASSRSEFFRSPEFFEAEGVTHSLVISPVAASADYPATGLPAEAGPAAAAGGQMPGPRLAASLIVREIPAGGIDAVSPYGYPGFEIGERRGGPVPPLPLDPSSVDFSGTGLVSAFIRHSLPDQPPLAGARPRNLCLLADPTLEPKSRMSDRQQIRKNLRAGFTLEITAGPETGPGLRADFLRAYTQTMVRTAAAGHYFFDAAYFDAVLGSDRTWLVVVREPEGEVAAASIAAASDGLLHYYLSGTADEYLKGSPMKNLLAGMIEFAAEMQMPLNLGGGITPGDRLEEFKRGFANREEQWFTSELVCDGSAYSELCAAAGSDPSGDFFPAYRA